MAGVLGIVVLIAAIGGYVKYGSWLTSGIKPRTFSTSMSQDQVRRVFTDRVARTGWKVVDDGNPLVVQSSLATGIRQPLGLTTRSVEGRTMVRVGPERWVTKWGVPKKGHTIRIRMNSFVDAVRQHDAQIAVTVGELRSR